MLKKLPSVGKRSGLCCPSGCFARRPFVDGLIQHYDRLGLRGKEAKLVPYTMRFIGFASQIHTIISGTRWVRISIIYPTVPPSFTMALQPGTKAFTERKAASTTVVASVKK